MNSLRSFLNLIKFEHTIFALPFAYLGMVLAADGFPGWGKFIGITIAMAAARTLAMGFNRIADRAIDARNPRTVNRPLITGSVSLTTAWVGTILSGVVLIAAAAWLGRLPLVLLPGALVFLLGYSYTKRFTPLSHLILGITDGLAPMGAWVAVRGTLFTRADLPAWLLLAIVTLWIGGFDLIYACQDVSVDRREGLHSVPARWGVAAALRISTFAHALMGMLLIALGLVCSLSWAFFAGLMAVMILLVYEHRLVRPGDLSQINVAFFNINSYISITLFAAVLLGMLIQ